MDVTTTEAPAISSPLASIVVQRNATSLPCGISVIASNSNAAGGSDISLVSQSLYHSKDRRPSYMSAADINPKYCKKRRKEQRARMWPPPTRLGWTGASIPPNRMLLVLVLVSLVCTVSFPPVISALRFTRTEASNRARSPSSQYYPMYYPNDLPIVAGPSRWDGNNNNNIAFQVSSSGQASHLPSTFSGGEIRGHQVLTKQVIGTSSPSGANVPDYKIFSDIIVLPDSRLDIEPGVVLAFAPKTGITVRGTLIANVSNVNLCLPNCVHVFRNSVIDELLLISQALMAKQTNKMSTLLRSIYVHRTILLLLLLLLLPLVCSSDGNNLLVATEITCNLGMSLDGVGGKCNECGLPLYR